MLAFDVMNGRTLGARELRSNNLISRFDRDAATAVPSQEWTHCMMYLCVIGGRVSNERCVV